MHLAHHVLAVHPDGGRFGGAQRRVQHGAVLGDVDLLAVEHRVPQPRHARCLGELPQQPQRLVGDQVLGVVDGQVADAYGVPLGTLRIVLEELPQVGAPERVAVPGQLLPLGQLIGSGAAFSVHRISSGSSRPSGAGKDRAPAGAARREPVHRRSDPLRVAARGGPGAGMFGCPEVAVARLTRASRAGLRPAARPGGLAGPGGPALRAGVRTAAAAAGVRAPAAGAPGPAAGGYGREVSGAWGGFASRERGAARGTRREGRPPHSGAGSRAGGALRDRAKPAHSAPLATNTAAPNLDDGRLGNAPPLGALPSRPSFGVMAASARPSGARPAAAAASAVSRDPRSSPGHRGGSVRPRP